MAAVGEGGERGAGQLSALLPVGFSGGRTAGRGTSAPIRALPSAPIAAPSETARLSASALSRFSGRPAQPPPGSALRPNDCPAAGAGGRAGAPPARADSQGAAPAGPLPSGRGAGREAPGGNGRAGAAVGAGLPRGRAARRRAPADPRPHGRLRAGRRLRLPGAGQHQGAGRRLRAPRDARLPEQGAAGPGAGQLPVQHGHLQHGRAQAAAPRRPQVQRDDAAPEADLRGRHPHAALPALPDRRLRADLAGGRRELLRLRERRHPRGDRRRDPAARLRLRQFRGLRGGQPAGRPELHRGGGRGPAAGAGAAAQGRPDRPAGAERPAARGPPGAPHRSRQQGLPGRPRRAGPGGAGAPARRGGYPGELNPRGSLGLRPAPPPLLGPLRPGWGFVCLSRTRVFQINVWNEQLRP